jgi:hypothetical protein
MGVKGKISHPNCVFCGKPGRPNGSRNGIQYFRALCHSCESQLNRSGYVYGQHKGDKCELCGFIPINSCQLAVHHIDGDRMNNIITNLQTICFNCHALISFSQKPFGKRGYALNHKGRNHGKPGPK